MGMAFLLSPRSFRYYERARGVRPWAPPLFTYRAARSGSRVRVSWQALGTSLELSTLKTITRPRCTRRKSEADEVRTPRGLTAEVGGVDRQREPHLPARIAITAVATAPVAGDENIAPRLLGL